jgi:hypothetical protein
MISLPFVVNLRREVFRRHKPIQATRHAASSRSVRDIIRVAVAKRPRWCRSDRVEPRHMTFHTFTSNEVCCNTQQIKQFLPRTTKSETDQVQ